MSPIDQSEDTSYSVVDPEIPEVLDTRTGEKLAAYRVIGQDYDRAIQLRMAAKTSIGEGAPRYLCPECYVPVYLSCLAERRSFFFKHLVEDGNCAAITRGLLSQKEINARKYNGAKESALHREMKKWVIDSLTASGKFTEIEPEKRWTGRVTGKYRQPDVSGTWNGLKVAFEIQLSTTFLDVIAQRRLFYLKEGGLLFWIFANFEGDSRRLTQDDVFFNNNQNAFIVSASTCDASVRAGDFLLDCLWSEPSISGDSGPLRRKRISFSELTLDPGAQRSYYYDFEGEKGKLQASEDSERRALADAFEEWWLRMARDNPSQYDQENVLRTFAVTRPQGWSIPGPVEKYLPAEYWDGRRLPVALLNVLYSCKHGTPVGLKRTHFIEVAHYTAEHRKEYLSWFRKALAVWGRGDLLKEQDRTGKWRRRVATYKQRMMVAPEQFQPDRADQALVELLFPELVPLP